MDGAIILAGDASRIARANVHLVPKATISTSETGTRHRTAERVARSIDVPVIAVSEAMATIAVYRNDRKHTTQSAGWLIDRSSQALSTLQRFRSRYDDALSTLTRLEMEDSVSVRDVVPVLQPGEMVRRIAEEIEGHLVELGSDGRLIHLQTEELRSGVDREPDARPARLRRRPGDRPPALAVGRRADGPAQGGGCPRTCPPPTTSSTASWHRTGTACCTGCPSSSPRRSSSAWWAASARCPRSSPLRPPSSSRSTASAPPRPATSATAWPAWSRRASSSDTNDRVGLVKWSVAVGRPEPVPEPLHSIARSSACPCGRQLIHPRSRESCALQGRRQSRLSPPRGRRH